MTLNQGELQHSEASINFYFSDGYFFKPQHSERKKVYGF